MTFRPTCPRCSELIELEEGDGLDARCWKCGKPLFIVSYRRTEEYRPMVEARLGRKLGKLEYVHHVNGDPGDNSWENLVVCTPLEHATMHRGSPERAAAVLVACRERQGWGFEKAA